MDPWKEYERMRNQLLGPPDMSAEIAAMEMYMILNSPEYFRQVRESDGFFVDINVITRKLNIHNTLVSFDYEHIGLQLTKFAIDAFNLRRLSFQEDTHGELEFVKLLNAIRHDICGNLCYLTFEAKNLGDGNTYTYQAVVCNTMPYLPNTVKAFRLKPAPGSTKAWFWKDHCCEKRGDQVVVPPTESPTSVPYRTSYVTYSDHEEIVSQEKGDEEKSGEGVPPRAEISPTSVPYSKYSVTLTFVINAEVGYKIIDACRARHIRVLTGADYSLEETIYPDKKVIVLKGTPEEVHRASPMILECISKFQDY